MRMSLARRPNDLPKAMFICDGPADEADGEPILKPESTPSSVIVLDLNKRKKYK